MSERLFRPQLERQLEEAFKEIKEREEEQEELLEKEKDRVKELLTAFTPLEKNHVFKEDFNVAAVDGSSISPLLQYEDILVYLVTANLVVMNTGTRSGDPMTPIGMEEYTNIPEDGYLTSIFWSGYDQEELWENFIEFTNKNYRPREIADILLPYFQDKSKNPNLSLSEIYQRYRKSEVSDFVIIPPIYLPNRVGDHLRWIAEISLGKHALESSLDLRYLIYDTTLTLLIPRGLDYPNLMSSYLIRGACRLAREKDIAVLGVSKTHTMPAGEKIARMAKDMFGERSNWFMRIPGSRDPKGKLEFTSKRRIPPKLAVTYLFRFSDSMPVFRVDMDKLWWEKHIQDSDPHSQREMETDFFQELEFISRDARWYGYPCPPAFAHVLASITREERIILEDKSIEIGKRLGFFEESLLNARRRIGLE